ncbi:MAG: PEP-CTERM sorting domain-containing protein [Armatimonadota bacterium]
MKKYIIVTTAALLLALGLAPIAHAGILMDESNATLAGDAGLGYNSQASPGTDPNFLGFKNGSASWTISVDPGQKYKLTSRRTVTTTNNTRFAISFDGQYYITDLAYTADAAQSDQMLEYTFLGYFMTSNAAATVLASDGGDWFARLDYLSLDATSDVYFDENSTPAYTGTAAAFTFPTAGSWPANPGTLPNTGPNGFALGSNDSVSGSVELISGMTYKVYASRQVNSTGNFAYDLSLNGQLFAHDTAVTVDMAHNDFLEEALLGTYTATSAATSVAYTNGGPWASRVDYLRFEAVPEPGSLVGLSMALLSLAGLTIRRRK